MKKKYSVTSKDKKDWLDFTRNMEGVKDKDFSAIKKDLNIVRKLDLHGCSLDEANRLVKKFIIESAKQNLKKLLIITGKGLRSKIHDDPYRSKKMNVLRYSIPEYIKNDEELSNKIIKISKASISDGGDGAIYVFLKSKLKL